MMSKSLNYAYPQKFAEGGEVQVEGGEVQVTDLSGLKQEPMGNDMVLVKFQDGSYGKTQKALFQAAESLGAPMGSQKDFANWHLNEWAPKVASDPAFIAAHDQFNTDQIAYNQAVMDSDPQYAKNRLAFVQTHAPNNAAAISAAEELVATGNYASAISPAATDSNASAPLNYLGAGASLVENDGQMVSSDALRALQMSVGLQEQDMRYDADQDGRLGSSDALLFEKYAQMSDYDDSSGFMAGFYGQGNGAPPSEQKSTSYAFVDADGNSYSMGDARPGHDGTSLERAIANVQEHYDFAPGSFTVSVPSEERLVGTYDSGSGSFQAATSDMRDPNGFSALPGEGLMPNQPPPGMATTMAMGEEDTPFLEPDFDDIIDIFGPGTDDLTATTMAMGEEDGGGLMPPPSVDPVGPAPDPFSLPPGVDPMFPAPVMPGVTPVMPAPVTPSPVVNPVFTPSPDNTAFTPPPPPPVEGRTYGAYSGTPMGPTNSIQPFTPYMPPQQAQGPDLQSLITDTDYLLNNSGPRTSVFQRS